jgi:hypothetical protein
MLEFKHPSSPKTHTKTFFFVSFFILHIQSFVDTWAFACVFAHLLSFHSFTSLPSSDSQRAGTRFVNRSLLAVHSDAAHRREYYAKVDDISKTSAR